MYWAYHKLVRNWTFVLGSRLKLWLRKWHNFFSIYCSGELSMPLLKLGFIWTNLYVHLIHVVLEIDQKIAQSRVLRDKPSLTERFFVLPEKKSFPQNILTVYHIIGKKPSMFQGKCKNRLRIINFVSIGISSVRGEMVKCHCAFFWSILTVSRQHMNIHCWKGLCSLITVFQYLNFVWHRN